MKIKKTIKKLKQLKSMVKMIPAKNIDLSMYVTHFNPDSQEDCVMCLVGWITQFPFLDPEEKLWIGYEDGKENEADIHYEGEDNTYTDLPGVLSEMFGLTESWTDEIFFNRDYEEDVLTHKAHILEVIDNAIEDYKYERARKDAWPF